MKRYVIKKELFLVLKCRADTKKKKSFSVFCSVLAQTAHSRKYYLFNAHIKLM